MQIVSTTLLAIVAQANSLPASALTLERPILVGEQASEAVAGYVRIRNSAAAPDALIAASCTCAERIEFHVIRRGPDGVSMTADPELAVPAGGTLDIRPGSDLHLMLINYRPDPSRKARLTLTFRNGGTMERDFALTSDSKSAWAAFDKKTD